MTFSELAISILDHVKSVSSDIDCAGELEFKDTLRRALGLALSSIHSNILSSVKTENERTIAVNMCLDTLERLMNSMKESGKTCGIEVTIEKGEKAK